MPDAILPDSESSVTDGEGFPELDPVAEYVLACPDLKSVIMDCYFAGYFTRMEAEDLIHHYGLVGA